MNRLPDPRPPMAAVLREGTPSDPILVRRAQRGDVSAFETLYRSHADRVHGLCLRLSADPARAEELTQEAFVRAWEKLGSFRGDSGFGTWLHRLAVNVALGDQRTHRRREAGRVSADEGVVGEPRAPHSHPGTALDLERAIAALPAGARAIFVLHDVEGYRHGEIAALTGVTEGTSKAQLHRARQLLRKALGR